jgi:hypothetical protein
MSDRKKVNADLVRPAGLQLGQKQIRALPALEPLEARFSDAAGFDHGLFLTIVRRTADRGVDRHFIFR